MSFTWRRSASSLFTDEAFFTVSLELEHPSEHHHHHHRRRLTVGLQQNRKTNQPNPPAHGPSQSWTKTWLLVPSRPARVRWLRIISCASAQASCTVTSYRSSLRCVQWAGWRRAHFTCSPLTCRRRNSYHTKAGRGRARDVVWRVAGAAVTCGVTGVIETNMKNNSVLMSPDQIKGKKHSQGTKQA